MVAQLRAKPGGDDIGVTIGDFATTRVDGTFRLAYLVRNTIMNLTTQDEQVACFGNVAAQLEPGGCFVIEVIVPQLQRLPPGETVRPFTVTPTHLGFDEFDVATQTAFSHHYWVVDGRLETLSAPFRYVWPSELDLMARLAGMSLRERWGDWDRAPFTSDSAVARFGLGEDDGVSRRRVGGPPMTDQYLAGACNIGPAEIAMRRRAGHAGLVVTAALAAALLRSDLHPAWRLVLALPAAGSAAGYLQARQRFCANFGWRGVHNFGAMGQEQRVADEGARAEDRRRALRIMGASAAVGAGVALTAMAVG